MPPPLALAGLLAATTLFPSYEYGETGFEGFGRDVLLEPVPFPGPFTLPEAEGGFGWTWHTVLDDKGAPLIGASSRLRFVIDRNAAGQKRLMWEDFTVAPGLIVFMARPSLGTVFDMGIGPYQTELPILWRHTPGVQARMYVPVTFVPLGLSNTDQDDDARLKYAARAGGGLGLDVIAGTGIAVVALRAQGDWQYVYRAGARSASHGRSDAEWLAEVGVGLRQDEESAVLATFFVLDRYQWTYGTDTSGPHRTAQTLGARISIRGYPKKGGIELPGPDELNRDRTPLLVALP